MFLHSVHVFEVSPNTVVVRALELIRVNLETIGLCLTALLKHWPLSIVTNYLISILVLA